MERKEKEQEITDLNKKIEYIKQSEINHLNNRKQMIKFQRENLENDINKHKEKYLYEVKI